MSALAQTIEEAAAPPFEYALALDLATAPDLSSGRAQVLSSALVASGAARVEWWEDDEFVAAEGLGSGRRYQLDLDGFAVLVFYGGTLDVSLVTGLQALLPLLRRLRADEALAVKAGELVRRNETLEEFAALVAHELKTPLHEALLSDDASEPLHEALDLVDALLRTAHDVRPVDGLESATESLETAVNDLGARAAGLEVTSDLTTSLPISVGALRIILRNFLTNALSAGAQHVHVMNLDSSTLVVDDDGVGLGDADYESGSGLGLDLCRRLAKGFGARIELTSRQGGGTSAMLAFGRV